MKRYRVGVNRILREFYDVEAPNAREAKRLLRAWFDSPSVLPGVEPAEEEIHVGADLRTIRVEGLSPEQEEPPSDDW